MSPARLLAGLICLTALGSTPGANGAARPPRPNSANVRVTPAAAQAALDAGDPRKALALLDSRAMEIDDADRHSIAGRAYLALGDHERARRELTDALRLRPTHAGDLHALGRALAACGAFALADARYADAHWRGRDSAELHHDWASALLALGETQGELTQRDWPADMKGEPTPGRLAFGGVILGPVPGQPGKIIMAPAHTALYHVHRALELAPARVENELLCARVWASLSRHEEASKRFAAAAAVLQGDGLDACRRDWAESLFAIGDFDGFIARSVDALKSDGTARDEALAACYDRVAVALGRRGEIRPQIQYLTLAAELRPSAERLIRLSDALVQTQRWDEAVARLNAARERSPTPKQIEAIQQRLRQASYLATPK